MSINYLLLFICIICFSIISVGSSPSSSSSGNKIPKPPVIVARADWRCSACTALTRAQSIKECCDWYAKLWPVASALPINDLQLRRASRWNELGPLDCETVCDQIRLLQQHRPGYNGTECELLRFCEVGAQRLVRPGAFLKLLLYDGQQKKPNPAAVAAKAAAKGMVAAVTAAVVPMSEQAVRWLATVGSSLLHTMDPQRWFRQWLLWGRPWSPDHELDAATTTAAAAAAAQAAEQQRQEQERRQQVVREQEEAAAAAAAEAAAARNRRLQLEMDAAKKRARDTAEAARAVRHKQEPIAVDGSSCSPGWLVQVALVMVALDCVQNWLADRLQLLPFSLDLDPPKMTRILFACNKLAQILSFSAALFPVWWQSWPAFRFMGDAAFRRSATAAAASSSYTHMAQHAHSKPAVRCHTHAFVCMTVALVLWNWLAHCWQTVRAWRTSTRPLSLADRLVGSTDWVRLLLRTSNPVLLLLTVVYQSPSHWWVVGQLFFVLELCSLLFALVQLFELERLTFGFLRLIHFQLLVHSVKCTALWLLTSVVMGATAANHSRDQDDALVSRWLSVYRVSVLLGFILFVAQNIKSIVQFKIKFD